MIRVYESYDGGATWTMTVRLWAVWRPLVYRCRVAHDAGDLDIIVCFRWPWNRHPKYLREGP